MADDSTKTLWDDAVALSKQAQAEQAALETEFVAKGQPIPADRQKAVDDKFDAAEAKTAEAEAHLKAAERTQKSEGLAERLERLAKSAGRPPVGVPGNANERDREGSPTVVYKGRDGQRKTFAPTGRGESWTPEDEVAYTEAFRNYVAKGGRGITAEQAELEARRTTVAKGLLSGLDTSGGFWTVPEVVETQLIEAIQDMVFMRQLADVRTYQSAVSIRVMTAGELDDSEWTQEVNLSAADAATPAGGRRLSPHPITKLVKASEDELAQSLVDSEGYIMRQIGYRNAATEERGFMVGTGSGQAEGLFVSSLPTFRSCAGAADPTTTLDPLDFIDVTSDLKSQYRAGASWIAHREVERRVKKFQLGNGEFIWQPGLTLGTPNVLCGYPVNVSEYAPSTFTTGKKIAALGNWKSVYRIADIAGSQIRRLDELFALSNEIGFKSRRFVDGMVVNGNGAVILTLS